VGLWYTGSAMGALRDEMYAHDPRGYSGY
jgi:hypothetical protein